MSDDPSSHLPESFDKPTSQPFQSLSSTINLNPDQHPVHTSRPKFIYPPQTTHQIQSTHNYDLLEADQSNEMMAHMSRADIGYGYMPQAIPAYPPVHAYQSTMTALPDYYPDSFRQPATSPQSSYLSNRGYSRYNLTSREDREQIQKQRRRSSIDRRHQNKLASRKASAAQSNSQSDMKAQSASRLPSIMGTALEESPIQSSPIDLFTTQAPLQTSAYITESFQRAASYERSPSLRDEYRVGYNMTQPSMSEPPSYPTYSMPQMGSSMSSLAPLPPMPSPSPSHQTSYPLTAHSSPLLMPNHNFQSHSPHPESLVLDNSQRDKPQCWDHGCNGREFSTFSNLLRHQREKSGSAAKAYCPRCGAEFTRTTARNGHMEHGKCKGRRASGASIGAGAGVSGSSQGGSSVSGAVTRP